ncbi:efflux RND transporter periplasmic adaptor subunit [Paenibacillus radicis (ex Xue et al. 2023)]|uniref:Efflux RND transporter periplasmic adaptor subunit n=1 Tax=Paenibacillus radicis (ex Xue et al. 2023) TaxID=2972489 RepID=A0ABT1YMX7_9BACL|nr:efflux RND transporter periplasmic adaptor subunit [Paenibacillus radicis (ex Xue et al. 2023)]MCR8633643.1 efflux RND transporter periplasmic adaptor subunit [Paenibacillus radicis (ex Xue et al. 2023)]
MKHRFSAWKSTVAPASMILLCAVVAAGCSVTSAKESQLRQVKVAPVAKQAMEGLVEQDADVVSSSQVNVTVKVGGDVQQLLKKRGEPVRQGEVILKLDTADMERSKRKTELTREGLQSQLVKTREDVATNKAVLKNTIGKLGMQIADLEKAYNNLRNDYDQGIAAKSQLEKAETQWKTAILDLDTAQKQLANLEATDPLATLKIQLETTEVGVEDINKTISDLEVKAPISGILTDLFPEQGMSIQSGYVAGVIQQLDPVKIHSDLTEAQVKLARGKSEVSFTLPGSNDKFQGAVTYLADVMSPQSKTFVMELTAKNDGFKLKPGTRVKLLLGDGGKQDALALPTSAVAQEGNEMYAYVLAGEQVEKRKVTLGRAVNGYREVVSGLKEGEQIVISVGQGLLDKEKVEIIK